MTPHRRWSFSLRMLFVVMTVFACWMGWRVSWIVQRRALLAESELVLSKYGKVSGVDCDELDPLGDTTSTRLLGIVGEAKIEHLFVFYLYGAQHDTTFDADGYEYPTETADYPKIRRSRRLFPEARITAVGVDKRNMNGHGHTLDGLISE